MQNQIAKARNWETERNKHKILKQKARCRISVKKQEQQIWTQKQAQETQK